MTPREGASYRLRLADLSLGSAQDSLSRARWRDAALFARAAVEHATKAILACFAAVPRTHEPREALDAALGDPRFPAALRDRAEALVPRLAAYGTKAHLELSYGDEQRGIDPWAIVTEERGRRDLAVADETVVLARDCIATLFEAV